MENIFYISFDSVRYDGDSASSPLLASFHGVSNNITFITSSRPAVTIKFTSDGSNTNTGFKLEWQCMSI